MLGLINVFNKVENELGKCMFPIKSGMFKVEPNFFYHLKIKIGLPWHEIAKNKVAKITCTYFADKSQKFAPTEKNSYIGTLVKGSRDKTFGNKLLLIFVLIYWVLMIVQFFRVITWKWAIDIQVCCCYHSKIWYCFVMFIHLMYVTNYKRK